jgi:hypothetical protein
MSDQARSVVGLLSGGLRAGDARSSGPLTLVPLFGGTPAPSYLLAADAFGSGLLTISEVGIGSVPELVADNRAELPVLLLDGEHLEGAKQHRVLNVTVLLAPRHRTVIPVTCVEQGRWHYAERSDFASSPIAANPRLRGLNAFAVARSARGGKGRRADQAAAWSYVDSMAMQLGAERSPTGAVRDYYEHRRRDLDAILKGFPGPHDGQTGVAACVGGRVMAVDTFDRPKALAGLWPRLISGYAADALGRPEVASEPGVVDRFLTMAASGEITSHEGVGLGMDVFLTSESSVGSALVWEESAVHVAIFAGPEGGNGEVSAPPIASPRHRARLRRHFHTS